ncbi:MAG: 6-phosphogluconolactonase [Woeseia sp.]
MDWRSFEDASTGAREAAAFIASQLRQAVEERGRATFAISGGSTPWDMFERLAAEDVPWTELQIVQVDERIVPLDHEARNWAAFLENPLASRMPQINCHAMPVDLEEIEAAIKEYRSTLTDIAGDPPVLDVVHLGIGEDGHTASLFGGDPLLDERERLVGASRPYEGHRRMSLTLPVLNDARCVVWFAPKSPRDILERLRKDDTSIPAGRVRRDRAVVFAHRDPPFR